MAMTFYPQKNKNLNYRPGMTVFDIATGFNCNSTEVINFLKKAGVYIEDIWSPVTENAYNLARNYFLGVPIPEKPKPTPKPQEKPKSTPSTPSSTQITPQKQEIDAQTILNGYAVAEI